MDKQTSVEGVKSRNLDEGMNMASLAAVVSFGLICLSLGGLFSNVDSRLILTASQTFGDLAGIRDIFNQTTNYTVIHNPRRVDHVPFPPGPESLEEVQDMRDRGLLSEPLAALFKPVTGPDPSLLHRLLQASWCSGGPPLAGSVMPANRTPGCKCIADAYLDFIGSSLPANVSNYTVSYSIVNGTATTVLVGAVPVTVLVNGTNTTVLINGTNTTVWVNGTNTTVWVNGTNTTIWVNGTNVTVLTPTLVSVSQAVRDRVGSRVYRCWDQRQVTRSRTCGNLCKTHVIGLALFADIVLFLTCSAFLIFYSSLHQSNGLFTLKLLLVLLAGIVSIPYFVKYPEANSLNVAAIVVCVLYLIIGLHEELDYYGMWDKLDTASQNNWFTRPIPSPFTVCILVTLPLIISSHTIQLGVSGYGRDVWALFSFGLCGGLLGLLLQVDTIPFYCYCCLLTVKPRQRYFWASVYLTGDGDYVDMARISRMALAGAYVCVQILLLLLYFAYRYTDGPYTSGDPYIFFFYQGFLTLLIAILGYDRADRLTETVPMYRVVPGFTPLQSWFVLLVVLSNVGMSVLAFMDVSQHPS